MVEGKLHLPKLHSPEYGDDADNNYNLSLLRWGCQTLIDLNQRYPLNDPLVPTWRKTLDELVPYPVDGDGLRIGADVSYTKSHRHWSHILMVHPLHIMTGDQPAERELLEKSVLHWLTVGNSKGINGWSRAAAASLYATLDPWRALEHEVILTRLEDGESKQIDFSAGGGFDDPAWSPDSRQLAYVSFEGNRSSIWIQTLRTGNRFRVSGEPGINGAPSFSPDGRRVAFSAIVGGFTDLFVADVQTGESVAGAVGFLGVLTMLRPGAVPLDLAAGLALLGALLQFITYQSTGLFLAQIILMGTLMKLRHWAAARKGGVQP